MNTTKYFFTPFNTFWLWGRGQRFFFSRSRKKIKLRRKYLSFHELMIVSRSPLNYRYRYMNLLLWRWGCGNMLHLCSLSGMLLDQHCSNKYIRFRNSSLVTQCSPLRYQLYGKVFSPSSVGQYFRKRYGWFRTTGCVYLIF